MAMPGYDQSDLITRMRFDALIAEYNQMHAQFREYSRTMTSRESLFATLSFGVLAYTLAYDIGFLDLMIASIVSMSIFIHYMYACERALYYIERHMTRSKEIEGEVNDILDADVLRFQTGDALRYNRQISQSIEKIGWHDPTRWLRFAGMSFEGRRVRLIMLALLLVLWVFRIF